MKGHYPKLYNMDHILSLNVFTASKGSNNYILFVSNLYISSCYMGNITRKEAERQLLAADNEAGMFLIRESESYPGDLFIL